MNNKYACRENDVLVNTDKGIEPREYVDNFDDILRVENNIDILETRIKCSKHTLNNLMSLRRMGKAIVKVFMGFGIFLSLTIIGAEVFTSVGPVTGFIIPALKFAGIGIGVCAFSALMSYLPVVAQGAKKKNIKNLENRISVYQYELEQEEKILSQSKEKSKKIEVPKNDKIIEVSKIYQIENLKTKLNIVERFKKVPNLFIDEYNNGTIEDVLGDLGCTDMIEGIQLVKYLVDEYQKQQSQKEIIKGKTKSKNKR